jgi:putative serine/threonine protein kinase
VKSHSTTRKKLKALRQGTFVAIEQLREEPYASIICYPHSSQPELKKRLEEMRKLNVSGLVFAGEKQVFGKLLLGKGCVGLVAVAHVNGKKAALKIRRLDADRKRMQREARLLRKANSASVGPKLIASSRNFLLMQYIDGKLLPDWLGKNPDSAEVMRVASSILTQCFQLDEVGLDHGELSHAPKHVIVTRRNRPFIVDFETASLNRRPSNVTSMCQFLFLSSQVGTQVAERLSVANREAILAALRSYKSDRSRETFRNVLSACGL